MLPARPPRHARTQPRGAGPPLPAPRRRAALSAFRRAGLASALLVAGSASISLARRPDGACRLPAVTAAPLRGEALRDGRFSPEDCSRYREASSLLARLLRAAELPATPLLVDRHSGVGADDRPSVTLGLLRHPRASELMAGALSHEAAHLRQYRSRLRPRSERQLEAHADVLGALLLLRAGLDPEATLRAFDADAALDGARRSPDHPTFGQRRSNIRSMLTRLRGIKTIPLDWFDVEGELRPPGVRRPD